MGVGQVVPAGPAMLLQQTRSPSAAMAPTGAATRTVLLMALVA
jgi:hypothetical protein